MATAGIPSSRLGRRKVTAAGPHAHVRRNRSHLEFVGLPVEAAGCEPDHVLMMELVGHALERRRQLVARFQLEVTTACFGRDFLKALVGLLLRPTSEAPASSAAAPPTSTARASPAARTAPAPAAARSRRAAARPAGGGTVLAR